MSFCSGASLAACALVAVVKCPQTGSDLNFFAFYMRRYWKVAIQRNLFNYALIDRLLMRLFRAP